MRVATYLVHGTCSTGCSVGCDEKSMGLCEEREAGSWMLTTVSDLW